MTFSKRLVDAFDGASMAEIARRLDVPHSTIRNYVRHDRLPSAEVLTEIANRTNVSLNWLLTGRGERHIGSSAQTSRINPQLLAKLHSIAEEQAQIVFADLDIAAGTLTDKALDFLVEYLLYRALVGFNLIVDGDILPQRDLKRGRRFTFVDNLSEAMDDIIRKVVKQELIKQQVIPGEVGDIEPADMILAPHMRTIDVDEVKEIERRLTPRRRKTG